MGGDGSHREADSGRRVPRAVELLVVGLLLIGVAVAATWPLARSPSGHSLATGANADVLLNQYLILWGAHALTSADAELPHTNMFYPERYTFAYSDMLLSSSLLAYPLIRAGGDPDLVYNLLLLSSMVIGGLGVYVLVRFLGLSLGAGVAAAILYAANPSHMSRIMHIQLFTDHWLPWLLWATLLWLQACGLRGGRRPRGWKPVLLSALTVAVLFCAQALTGSHNAVFGALLVSVLVAVHVIAAGRRLWSPIDRARLARLAAGSGLVAAVALAVLAPVFYPYLMVYQDLRESRLGRMGSELTTLRGGSAGLRELLSGASLFWRWLDQVTGWPSHWIAPDRDLRAHLFPGLVFTVLAGLGAWSLRPRRRVRPRQGLAWVLDLAALALAAVAVATAVTGRYDWAPLGIPLGASTAFAYPLGAAAAVALRRLGDGDTPWVGRAVIDAVRTRWRTQPDLVLWSGVALLCLGLSLGPDAGLYRLFRVLPGASLIRVPSRLLLPGLVAMALLAAYGVDRLQARLGRMSIPVLLALLALFAYEGRLAPLRVRSAPYPPDGLTEWLAAQPGQFAILEMPVDTSSPAEVRQMIRSTRHWKELLVGYSGSSPPGYDERMAWLDNNFPRPVMLARLRDLDVRYVIVDTTLLDAERASAARDSDELAEVRRFGNRIVYRLLDPPAADP